RNTSFSRDWSSDVCSSDLPATDGSRHRRSVGCARDGLLRRNPWLRKGGGCPGASSEEGAVAQRCTTDISGGRDTRRDATGRVERSEERRVGREWRQNCTQC